jgi:hypothetical protein
LLRILDKSQEPVHVNIIVVFMANIDLRGADLRRIVPEQILYARIAAR